MALVEPEGNNPLIQDVLARPGNDACADCGNPGKKKKKSLPSSGSFVAGWGDRIQATGLVSATANVGEGGKLAEWCRVHRVRVKGHLYLNTHFFFFFFFLGVSLTNVGLSPRHRLITLVVRS